MPAALHRANTQLTDNVNLGKLFTCFVPVVTQRQRVDWLIGCPKHWSRLPLFPRGFSAQHGRKGRVSVWVTVAALLNPASPTSLANCLADERRTLTSLISEAFLSIELLDVFCVFVFFFFWLKTPESSGNTQTSPLGTDNHAKVKITEVKFFLPDSDVWYEYELTPDLCLRGFMHGVHC